VTAAMPDGTGTAGRYTLNRMPVHDVTMAYVDVGRGPPILFLHGNPTSSYVWRNVIPHLEGLGRCVAPDLVGMGASDKLDPSGPHRYRFVEHRRYLDGFLDAADIGFGVTIVGHDWGAVLGFDWARRHSDAIRGLAYMETIVRRLTWDEWPEDARSIFQAMRSAAGEEMVLEKNLFVERILPASILRDLAEDEMEGYRIPFREPGEGRRPTLAWPRELPIDSEPADVVEIVSGSAEWLSKTMIPKLFINGEPGSILTGTQREFCRTWPRQREVTVQGIHFLQEDSPHEIGRALAEWVRSLDRLP
jgi:haloalkane dehalogenase